MGKYQKNIEAARQISVVQYLETYHPGELVRKTEREYCTRTHDSLRSISMARLTKALMLSPEAVAFSAMITFFPLGTAMLIRS